MLVLFCAFFCLFQNANAIALRNELDTISVSAASIPEARNEPYPELLEPGFKYAKPQGTGCDQSVGDAIHKEIESNPDAASKQALGQYPALDYKRKGEKGTTAWNGFCEMGWPACPDAIANRDYNYYAKSLGLTWIKEMGPIDKVYCHRAGFLEPELANLRNNFTALHAKAAELCGGKLSEAQYHQDKLSISKGINVGIMSGVGTNLMSLKAEITDARSHNRMPNIPAVVSKMELFDEKAASIVGAWNCALGDVGCDIAYCNYAYCLKPDGSVGTMEECEGWDPIHGSPHSGPPANLQWPQ